MRATAHPFQTFVPRNQPLQVATAALKRATSSGSYDLLDFDSLIVPETRVAFPDGYGGGGESGAKEVQSIAPFAPRPFDALDSIGWDVSIKASASFSARQPFELACRSAVPGAESGVVLAACRCDAAAGGRRRRSCRAAALARATRLFLFPAQPLPRAVVECMAKQRLPNSATAEAPPAAAASGAPKAGGEGAEESDESARAAARYAARAQLQQRQQLQQQQQPSLMLLRRLQWANAFASLYYGWRRSPRAAFYAIDSSPDAHYAVHFCAPWRAAAAADGAGGGAPRAGEDGTEGAGGLTALLLLSTRRARILLALLKDAGVKHTVLGEEGGAGGGAARASDVGEPRKLQRGDSTGRDSPGALEGHAGEATPRGGGAGSSLSGGVLVVARGARAIHGLFSVLADFVRDPPPAFGGSWSKEDVPQLIARHAFQHAAQVQGRAALSSYNTVAEGVSTRRYMLEVGGSLLPSALRELCALLGEGGGATPRRVRARTAGGAEEGEGEGANAGEGAERRRVYAAVLRGDERTLLLNSLNPAARTAPEGASDAALARCAVKPKSLVGLACWREAGRGADEAGDESTNGSTVESTAPRYVFSSELRVVRTHDAPGRAR